MIFSDGLDVDKIDELYRAVHGRVKVSFGWGTLLTNDFRGLVPGRRAGAVQSGLQGGRGQGRPTVKLSDNPNKAMGPPDEIERYKRVFGVGAQQRAGGGGLKREGRGAAPDRDIFVMKNGGVSLRHASG